MTSMKTRFAPSPTGLLHLGNVRTALFNWLCAKSTQGIFLLRIEDTDQERSRKEYVDALKRDLTWLGLTWSEGPDVGGDAGPYVQSERSGVYQQYYDQLLENKQAYPCFCTPQELSLSRKVQRSTGNAPRYAGTCANLSDEEVAKKKQSGMEFTLRFRVPNEGRVEFHDHVRGDQRFECNDIGDFIIMRSDGSPSFFFSNAIDDSLMNVTHVLRGEDHIANTPRQILILKALSLRAPQYGHISLIVGEGGGPLSKRDGSLGVAELAEQGYFPIAVINYLARLGHHYRNESFMSMDELAAEFGFEHLGKAPARYLQSQLLYWQHQAILNSTDETLWNWMKQTERDGLKLVHLVSNDNGIEFAKTIRENVLMPQDGLNWAANLLCESGLFDDKAKGIIATAGDEFFNTAVQMLDEAHADFKSYSTALGGKLGLKGKQLFMPLRAAMTGEMYAQGWELDWKRGPQMGDLWHTLGQARIKRRLELAATMA